jgi:uncharacterized PurR-regulated membrane protein YhhQ (DUF165 family)
MTGALLILLAEAFVAYLLVLGAHALRARYGLSLFYALIGGLTAVMVWVTDAGVCVHVAGLTFMTGSAVFYTALLFGVFVVYVFDGPRATRVAIAAVVGLSVLVPLVAFVVRARTHLCGFDPLGLVPAPSLRNNVASVVAAVADLLFLAVSWEYLGKSRVGAHLWLRTFLTLLGVMWLDVLLFTTGAFAGKPEYFNIMAGTLTSRLIITIFAYPFLYHYLNWQKGKAGGLLEDRPVLSILKEVADIRGELGEAQREIERRKQAEAEKAVAIEKLEATLLRVHRLEGMLPVCSACRRIRVESASLSEPARWLSLEDYLHEETPVQFSHGLCSECAKRLYPDYSHDL